MSASQEENQRIIAEQSAELNNKDNYTQPQKFGGRDTVLSDDSGVNEDAVSGFEGASVSTGRTGQTGGGTNSQLIPPEEGGEGRAGTQSDLYENAIGGKSDIQDDITRNNVGVNRSDSDNVRTETTGNAGDRPEQQLQDQEQSSFA